MENQFYDGLQISSCGSTVIFNLDNQNGLTTHFTFKATNAEILNVVNIKPTAITHMK